MTNEHWGSALLQWTLGGGVMAVVMGWLGKSRLRARTADACHLDHPAATLIIGLVCFAFFAGIAVVSNVFSNQTTTWLTTVVFVGFALLSALVVSGFFLERHDVSEEGIASRNFVGAAKYIRWSDLRSVRYVPPMKWFRLETQSGTVGRVSVMLRGLPEFARLLLHNAPAGAIEAQTLDVLRTTAAGNPPSVWR